MLIITYHLTLYPKSPLRHTTHSFLFVEKHIVSKAVELIEQMLPITETRDEILGFIKKSEIGVIKRKSQISGDEDIAF